MDENEQDEVKRLKGQSTAQITKMARDLVAAKGAKYVEIKGAARLASDETDLAAFLKAYSQIMEASIPFNLTTLDVMMACMSKLPAVMGLDILNNTKFIEMDAMLSALRSKMLNDRAAKIKASAPELFTPGADSSKTL